MTICHHFPLSIIYHLLGLPIKESLSNLPNLSGGATTVPLSSNDNWIIENMWVREETIEESISSRFKDYGF